MKASAEVTAQVKASAEENLLNNLPSDKLHWTLFGSEGSLTQRQMIRLMKSFVISLISSESLSL